MSQKSARSSKSRKSNRPKPVQNPEELSNAELDEMLSQALASRDMINKKLRANIRVPNRKKTVKEIREAERIAEASHRGPGYSDSHLKPFGSGMKSTVQIEKSAKYKAPKSETPAPTKYNPQESVRSIKPRSYEAFFTGRKFQRPKDEIPGPYDGHLKAFATNLCKVVDIANQSKYQFKPNSYPCPGQYESSTAANSILPRPKSAIIRENVCPYKRPKEGNPDPGLYTAHLKPFGADATQIVLGGKYKQSYDQNPGPGSYEIEEAATAIKHRPQSAVIKEPTFLRVKPSESSPDPGQYDAHLTPFGSGMKTNVDIGKSAKYPFKPDSNPPPGLYESAQALEKTRHRSPGVFIREPLIKFKRAPEPTPDPYDGHLVPFGQGNKNSMTLGGKAPFKPLNTNPPPGAYDVEAADKAVRHRSPNAKIVQDSQPAHQLHKNLNPSPEPYDGHLVPFGQDNKNQMTLGGKYPFKPLNTNPAPGSYDVEAADKAVRHRSPNAKIVQDSKPAHQLHQNLNQSPEPYDGHLVPFGQDNKNSMTLGGKAPFKPLNNNPAPGSYDVEAADKAVRHRSPNAKIISDSQPSHQLNTTANSSPDPYDGHLKPFGADSRNVVFASKTSPEKPNSNPGPGVYDAKFVLTKSQIQGGPYISHADDYEERNYGGDAVVNMSMQNPNLSKLTI